MSSSLLSGGRAYDNHTMCREREQGMELWLTCAAPGDLRTLLAVKLAQREASGQR